MSAAHAWAMRPWENIPEDSMDGVSTRETLLVSRSVAEKIGALRDACGGVAVVVSLPR